MELVNSANAAIDSKPVTTRRKRGMGFWLGRILLGFAVCLVALAGALYQAVATAADKRAYPPPGQLVDVGGYKLHINCSGEGSPTVVLETLSGGMSPYWAWVQPEVAKTTRVCSYDRAGRGWSEAGPEPMSARQTVDDLHVLLRNAGIEGPYVLVGHSIGGIYARSYAARYPDEVAGMVLVDAAHPEQLMRDPGVAAANEAYLQQSALFPILARFGVSRLYFQAGGEIDFQDLPPRQHAEVAAFWSSPEYFLSQRAEIAAAPGILSETQSLGGLGDLPLAVVTAGDGSSPVWLELQEELTTLSSNSFHQVVAEATHASLAFHPEHAFDTSRAILEVVEAVRAGQPLALEPR